MALSDNDWIALHIVELDLDGEIVKVVYQLCKPGPHAIAMVYLAAAANPDNVMHLEHVDKVVRMSFIAVQESYVNKIRAATMGRTNNGPPTTH